MNNSNSGSSRIIGESMDLYSMPRMVVNVINKLNTIPAYHGLLKNNKEMTNNVVNYIESIYVWGNKDFNQIYSKVANILDKYLREKYNGNI